MRSFLESISNSLFAPDPALKQFVVNALTAIRNAASGNANALVQDQFVLRNYPDGYTPPKLVPNIFTELTNGVADPEWLVNKVKIPKLPNEEKVSVSWCQHFGFGNKDVSPTVAMVNGMISGNCSPKQHLLQNFQFSGAFIENWILQDPTIVEKLPWLRQSVFGYSGIDLLTALPLDMAG